MIFEEQFKNQTNWANTTFPQANKHSIITHLRRELDELEKDDTREEFSDCLMLLMHYGDKMGMDGVDILNEWNKKLEICKKRTWKAPDEHGVCHHIKEVVEEIIDLDGYTGLGEYPFSLQD